MRETRCMSLLPRTTLHSDSEQPPRKGLLAYFRPCKKHFFLILKLEKIIRFATIETTSLPNINMNYNKNQCIFIQLDT
jgi:hypothetical protein